MRTYSVVKTELADSKAFIWNIKNYSLRRWKVKQPNFFNLSYKNLMSSSWPVRANLFIICFIGYGNSRFNRQFQGHRLWNASFYSIHLFLFLSIRPRLSRKDENTLHKYVRANTLSWYRRYLKSSDLTITFYFPYLVLNLKDGLYHSYCSDCHLELQCKNAGIFHFLKDIRMCVTGHNEHLFPFYLTLSLMDFGSEKNLHYFPVRLW